MLLFAMVSRFRRRLQGHSQGTDAHADADATLSEHTAPHGDLPPSRDVPDPPRLSRSASPATLPPSDAVVADEFSDLELVERARNGDLSAYNVLVQRHERAVFAVAMRYLRSREQAEDVVQDAFLRGWASLDRFRGEADIGFRVWLLRIASNRALDILRSQARRPSDSLDARLDDETSAWEPEADTASPLDTAVLTDLGEHLEFFLGQLHPDQRLVVILSDIQDLAYDEIATIAGVPVGTVKSRINRGRARLRELLLASERGRELLSSSQRPTEQTDDADAASNGPRSAGRRQGARGRTRDQHDGKEHGR